MMMLMTMAMTMVMAKFMTMTMATTMTAAMLRRMQQQVAGNLATNFGIINPLVLNQFGYGSYGQVCLQVQFFIFVELLIILVFYFKF